MFDYVNLGTFFKYANIQVGKTYAYKFNEKDRPLMDHYFVFI
jgi:hypothetical protein